MYAPQTWTPPYVDNNIETYQVILAIVMLKHDFQFSMRLE